MEGFIPETKEISVEVPFYEDATADEGWRGHSTGKSIERLKIEVLTEFKRYGVDSVNIVEGRFNEIGRYGYLIEYHANMPGRDPIIGRVKLAALPLKKESNKEKTLKMALFMFRDLIKGLWHLQQLSPGYSALMPWMLAPGKDKTITELWSEAQFGKMLPDPQSGNLDQ